MRLIDRFPGACIVVSSLLVLAATAACSSRDEPRPNEQPVTSRCEIVFPASRQTEIIFRIDDKGLMDSLLLGPLSKRKRDTDPALL